MKLIDSSFYQAEVLEFSSCTPSQELSNHPKTILKYIQLWGPRSPSLVCSRLAYPPLAQPGRNWILGPLFLKTLPVTFPLPSLHPCCPLSLPWTGQPLWKKCSLKMGACTDALGQQKDNGWLGRCSLSLPKVKFQELSLSSKIPLFAINNWFYYPVFFLTVDRSISSDKRGSMTLKCQLTDTSDVTDYEWVHVAYDNEGTRSFGTILKGKLLRLNKMSEEKQGEWTCRFYGKQGVLGNVTDHIPLTSEFSPLDFFFSWFVITRFYICNLS